jgi:hypothetical protein
MIDTDKYEGHSKGSWEWVIPEWGDDHIHDSEGNLIAQVTNIDEMQMNAQLIADAPLLLAEYKLLRKLMLKGSNGYTTSYTDLRDIIEEVHWALTGDDDEYTESSEARIKYALRILSEVIG